MRISFYLFNNEFTWSRDLTKIIYNSDSIDSPRLVQEDFICFHNFDAIIAWIKDLLSRSREISIQYTLEKITHI